MIKNRRNYYRILQVQPDAPAEIIHASYRALMRELKLHPDLGGSNEEAALINEAYDTVKDPQRRAAYDDELFHQFTMQTGIFARKADAAIHCPVCRIILSRKPQPGELCPNCRTPLQSDREPESARANFRTIFRTKNSVPIEYYTVWPDNPKNGRMMDFSPKGMRFICDELISPQTILKISCDLFQAAGIVTNASEETDRGHINYAIGVSFIAVRFDDPRGTFFSASA